MLAFLTVHAYFVLIFEWSCVFAFTGGYILADHATLNGECVSSDIAAGAQCFVLKLTDGQIDVRLLFVLNRHVEVRWITFSIAHDCSCAWALTSFLLSPLALLCLAQIRSPPPSMAVRLGQHRL
jgi:hypothetical protein